MASSSLEREMIKPLEVTKISPPSDSFSNAVGFSLPLTFFDILWFKFSPVEFAFFYHLPNLNLNSFKTQFLPKLKKSLSLTLLHYLPLAGTLTWPENSKPLISYNPGDGVSLTVAVSGADFNRLSGDETHEAIGFHPLIPQLTVSDAAAALLASQITLFPNQGFCVALTVHHGIFDGRGLDIFINSWAYFCKQDQPSCSPLPAELTPVFDRSVLKDPARLDMLYLNQWLDSNHTNNHNIRSLKISQNLRGLPYDLVRARFKLSRNDIKKLREIVVSKFEDQKAQIPHLSTFVLILAYMATCMVKARGGSGERIVGWGVPVDYRKRLDPPVPENYFGNVVGPIALFTKARDFMGENGIITAVKLISDGIKGYDMGEETQNRFSEFISRAKGPPLDFQKITVAGSPHFDFYGADFGSGRPKKVEIVSTDRTGAFSLLGRGDGKGEIEISLALKKHEMETFASLFSIGLSNSRNRSLL